jgi:glycogen operon protein
MANISYSTHPDDWRQLGTTAVEWGVQLLPLQPQSTAVELLLYADDDSSEPFQVIPLDACIHKTFFFWHLIVEDLQAGTRYAWRVDGPGNTPRHWLSLRPGEGVAVAGEIQ